MDEEKKTLAEMLEWLKAEGCSSSASRLSKFLSDLRQQRLQDRLLNQIANGARQCKAVEQQFGDNPAPELDTLIKLHRVLILQLSTQGNADPEFLKLADQMMRTAMEFVSAQTKAQFKERELSLGEAKFKESLRDKLQAGLDAVAEAFKTNPEAMNFYQRARSMIARETK